MYRLLFIAALSLTLTTVAGTSSEAGVVRISLQAPTMVDADTARITGTVTGRTTVTLQQSVSGRWTNVRSLTADAAGAFATEVLATSTPTSYRAYNGIVRSNTVVVQAPASTPDPEPDPEPEPDPGDPPTGASDACGPQPKKADGSSWVCTLADDFNGTALDRTVWMPQTIFKSGEGAAWACYLDDPSVISVADGALNLTTRKLATGQPCAGQKGASTAYAAGMVSTYRLFSQQYGRFEARIKNTATTSPGLQESFWLWPDDRYSTDYWPAAGEIDISETYSQYPDLTVPYLHYTATDNGGPVPGLNTSWTCAAQRGVWNTYTLEWTATRVEIFANGVSCLVNTTGDKAFQKRYIVALTQLLGVGGNAVRSTTPFPATMSVDYVRVWK